MTKKEIYQIQLLGLEQEKITAQESIIAIDVRIKKLEDIIDNFDAPSN